jgi:hypothetical protein
MKKILYIVPHLSTGGLPQYTLKMIQEQVKTNEVYLIEHSDITGGVLTVQRRQIIDILKDRFYTLGENKDEIYHIITKIIPNIIHFQEIPESFVSIDSLKRIYNKDRWYDIVVTTHGSLTDPNNIQFGADKFILVSKWSRNKFTEVFDESICDVWEYPIQNIEHDKIQAKLELGFDLNYKHVLNVGLFTSGKNQGELIELAKLFENEPIIFHFVGNQAENFKDYWEPIMKEFPSNCIWHGERSDVDLFYKASDAFYFTSNFELNPLVIKEALSYNLPSFVKKLETYMNEYDGKVHYISGNVDDDRYLLSNILFPIENSETVTIVLAHANTVIRKKYLKECIKSISGEIILSTNYKVNSDIQDICDHVLYMKDNPILLQKDFAKHGVSFNLWWIDIDGIRHDKVFEFEHGYSVYCLIRNALRYAKSIGKKIVHVVNYDYIINESTYAYNNKNIQDNDIIFYVEDHGDDRYCSAFFTAKINSIQPFFELYNSKDEYYNHLPNFNDGYNVLERKLYYYFNENPNFKILTQSIKQLESKNLINQESILSRYTKSKEYEGLGYQELCNKLSSKRALNSNYGTMYDEILQPYRESEINLFEISNNLNESVKIWENYLPLAKIYGMTNDDALNSNSFIFGNQDSTDDLKKIVKSIPKCHIIIDNGTHVAEHQLKSFHFLFENLLDYGGIYIIENIQYSYANSDVKVNGYNVGYLNIVDYFTKINHEINDDYNENTNILLIKSVSYFSNCIVIVKRNM